MKLTNKLHLPAPIVEAIANSGYNPGDSDITATGLIEPVRIHALKVKHAEEISEDVSDLIYSLQGQSIHTILERAAVALAKDGWIAEARYYMEVAGWKLGAQIDVFNTKEGLLQDYKVTSVYSVKDGIKEEYAKQMNIQAECLRQNGFDVKKLQIVAILRDWSKGERDRDVQSYGSDARYPEHQVKILGVPLIPREEVLDYIQARIALHKAALSGETPLPECTPEERWARPDSYAIMKKGQKRALKLFSSEEAAKVHIEALEAGHVIESRPGRNIRCESYCSVSKWCEQYKGMKK